MPVVPYPTSQFEPTQFFILPDPLLIDADPVKQTDAYASPDEKAPMVSPASTNKGNMSAFTMGSPTKDLNYDILLQSSGKLGEATWAFKKSSETTGHYRGENDRRYRGSTTFPFRNGYSILNLSSYSPTAVYSKKLNKEFCYTIEPSEFSTPFVVNVAHRSIDDRNYEGAWTRTTWSVPDSSSTTRMVNTASAYGQLMDVCEMPDGRLVCALISNGSNSGNLTDIDIFESSDGITWSLICDRVMNRLIGRKSSRITSIRLVSSGNYLRLVAVEFFATGEITKAGVTQAPFITGLISFDGGSSWDLTDEKSIQPGTTDYYGDRWAFDVCSIDEQGTFMLLVAPLEPVVISNSSTLVNGYKSYEGYIAVSDGSFSRQENLDVSFAGSFSCLKPFICKTPEWIFLYFLNFTRRMDYLDVGNIDESILNCAEYSAAYIPRSANFGVASWKSLGKDIPNKDVILYKIFSYITGEEFGTTGYCGSMLMYPLSGKLYWAGDSISFFHNCYESTKPPSLVDRDRTAHVKLGAWSKRPVRDFNTGNLPNQFAEVYKPLDEMNAWQPSGRLMVPQWESINGWPNAAESPWTKYYSSGYCLSSWSFSKLELYDASTSTPADRYCVYMFQDPCTFNGFRNSSEWSKPSTGTPISTITGICQYDYPASLSSNTYRKSDSPPSNWCFVPNGTNSIDTSSYSKFTPDVEPTSVRTHGACVVWNSYVGANVEAVPTALSAGVSLNSYIYGKTISNAEIENPTTVTNPILAQQVVRCEVRLGKESVVLYDARASSPLATLTPSTATYGTNPFVGQYWEFRWGWYPLAMGGKTLVSPSDENARTSCILMARKHGTEDWINTDLVYPTAIVRKNDTNYSTDDYNQSVSFGLYNKSAASSRLISFTSFGVHRGNDLTTAALSSKIHTSSVGYDIAPWGNVPISDVPRGFITSGNPVYMNDDIEVVWGGTGGMERDSFALSTQYTYGAKNTTAFSSPRTMWRSRAGATVARVDFSAGGNNIFNHKTLAFVGSNVRQGTVKYANASDFSSVSTTQDFDTTIATGSVSATTNGKWLVSYSFAGTTNIHSIRPGSFSSSDKRSFYMEVTNSTSGSDVATNTVLKIDQHIGTDEFTFVSPTSTLGASAIAGSSFAVFADRGFLDFDSMATDKFLRFEYTNPTRNYEGYAKLGSIVAGQKFTFSTPLDWSYSDNEQPINTRFETRSGIYWSYAEGPPKRGIQLKVVGDVAEEARKRFREKLTSLSKYSERPIVFCNNVTNERTDELVLAEYSGGTNMNNVGWYYDSENLQWKPVGDMSFSITEIV